MNAAQRRECILTRLNSAGAPLSASTLAAELGVSRQIVVGDVALLRACCDSKIKVKAAGGISSLEDAEDFIKLGADRLGTSRIVKLAMELEKAEGAPEEDY